MRFDFKIGLRLFVNNEQNWTGTHQKAVEYVAITSELLKSIFQKKVEHY